MRDRQLIDGKTVFTCSCKPCRGINPDVAGIVYPSQLSDRVQGYYFTPATMRLFSSRIGKWRRLTNPASAENRDGIAVIVSSRYDVEGAARFWEVITICAWGAIHRQEGPGGLDKCETNRAALKLLESATYPAACECHGCILDREGRA